MWKWPKIDFSGIIKNSCEGFILCDLRTMKLRREGRKNEKHI